MMNWLNRKGTRVAFVLMLTIAMIISELYPITGTVLAGTGTEAASEQTEEGLPSLDFEVSFPVEASEDSVIEEAIEAEENVDAEDAVAVNEEAVETEEETEAATEAEEAVETEEETEAATEAEEAVETEEETEAATEAEEAVETEEETEAAAEAEEAVEIEEETEAAAEAEEAVETEEETEAATEAEEAVEAEKETEAATVVGQTAETEAETASHSFIEKIEQFIRGGIPVAAVPTHGISFSGTSNLTMPWGDTFRFFKTDSITLVTDSDDPFEYRVIVSDIQVPDGGSYTWDGTKYVEEDGAYITFEEADEGRTYRVTYQVQYLDTDDNTWKDKTDSAHTTVINVANGAEYDYVTGDVACVSEVSLTVVADGTAPWDDDDSPGNDSSESNGIVRTFDQVTFQANYKAETKRPNDFYYNAYYWVEITLPCTREKAAITEMSGDFITAMAPYNKTVGDETHTVYTYYLKREKPTSDSGQINHALPEIGTFKFNMQVYSAKHGDTVKPTVGMAVCWTKLDENGDAIRDENGNLVVEKPYTAPTADDGVYDYPRYAQGPDIQISARPGFNVTLHSLAQAKTSKVHDFNATANTDALNYGIGKVYGRGVLFGIRVCLHSGDTNKGLKGLELPDGNPITFELELGASIKGNPVDGPLIWDMSNRGGAYEFGRVANGSYTDAQVIALTPFDMKKPAGTAFTSIPGGGSSSVSVWNGGDWTLEQLSDGKVKVTISNYVVNPFWFPLGYNSSPSNAHYAYTNGGQYKIGVFAAKKVHLVIPFGSNIKDTDRTSVQYLSEADPEHEYYYLNAYDLESGKIAIVVQDRNLDITSVSGQNSLDMYPDDQNGQTVYTSGNDRIAGDVSLGRGGSFGRMIRYSYNGTTLSNRDAANTDLAIQNGRDYIMAGGKVQILASASYVQRDSYEDQWICASQVLVKFDDEFLTPNGALPYPGECLFAGKAGGWASDEEMRQTGMEALTYFSTMEELEAAGMKCVGILREVISTDEPAAGKTQSFGMRINDLLVTKDPAYYNQVCMISMQVKYWQPAAYNTIVELNNGFPLYRNGLPQGKTVEDFIAETYGVTKDEVKPSRDDLNSKGNLGYRKAYYDEDGFHQGNGGEPSWGDSLYIVPYKMRIRKYVEQKTGPTSDNPVEYSLERGENIADFCLKPSFVLPEGFEEAELSDATTTVTVSDVLPAGLEFVPGSSYIGGSYVNNTPNGGGHGTVVDYLEHRDPDTIEKNSDGTTVLTWVLEDVRIGDNDALPCIHFAAHISESISEATTWINTGRVKSAEYNLTYNASRGNLDIAKISAYPANSLIVRKDVDQNFHNREDQITWTLRWQNKSAGTYDSKVLMDILPYDGDTNGSKIADGYDIVEIKYAFTDVDPGNFRFYYTTDEGARTGDALFQVFPYEEFVGEKPTVNGVVWTLGEISADGTPIMNLEDSEVLVAFALVGDISKQAEVKAEVTIQPNNAMGGDKYINTIAADSLRHSSQTQIVDRSISGMVWKEQGDPDGQRDSSESIGQGGVVVVLKILNENGEWVRYDATTTDQMGHYSFSNLPAGTFRVEFVNEGINLSGFRATEQLKEGVPEHVNSDGEALYDEEVFAVIENIVLPTVEEMINPYYSKENLDLGIWRPDLIVTKTLDLSALEDADAAAQERERNFLFRLIVPNDDENISYRMYNGENEFIGSVTAEELAAGYEFSLKDGDILRFEDLPANTTYTLEEYDYEGKHYGYAQSLTADSDSLSGILDQNRRVDVVNTYVSELVEVNVSKIWDDQSAEGLEAYVRPASVQVDLLADGEVVDSVILSEDNQWKHSFTNLPEYSVQEWPEAMIDQITPEKIQYTVEEKLVDDISWNDYNGERRFYLYNENGALLGYFLCEVQEEVGVFTITNSFVPATEEAAGSVIFHVKKVDEEGKVITADSATFELENQETKDVITAETKDGIASFTITEAGTYILKETKAPEGYILSEEAFIVTVTNGDKLLKEANEESNHNIYQLILTVDAEGNWDEDTLTLTVENKAKKEEEKKEEKLKIEKKANKTVVKAGDDLSYTIIVTNVGDLTIENIMVYDVLPEELLYISNNSGGQYGVENGKERIEWIIKSLAPGASVSFELKVRVRECPDENLEEIVNTAVAEYTDKDGKKPREKDSSTVKLTPPEGTTITPTQTPDPTPGQTTPTQGGVPMGDESVPVFLWLSLMLMAGLGIMAILAKRRKQGREEGC